MSEHRLPDIPIKPSPWLPGAWDISCGCGWGAVSDSPEAAVIGLAEHLESLWSKAQRLELAAGVIEAAKPFFDELAWAIDYHERRSDVSPLNHATVDGLDMERARAMRAAYDAFVAAP